MFVELDEGRLELLLNVRRAEVVGELRVGERLALGRLRSDVLRLGGVGH